MGGLLIFGTEPNHKMIFREDKMLNKNSWVTYRAAPTVVDNDKADDEERWIIGWKIGVGTVAG